MQTNNSKEKVRQLQNKLYLTAKKCDSRRFHALYDKVYRDDVLYEAWKWVKANKGSSGVDGIRIEDIEAMGIEKYLSEIKSELMDGKYKPSPVKRVMIPKPDGSERPLGIPTVKDRIVQMATKIAIEPVFEADFRECSYGFRPKRSAKQALEVVRKACNNKGYYVVDADIEKFFDNVNQGKLMKLVEQRISDRRILKLIKQWLVSGVLYGNVLTISELGTSQGSLCRARHNPPYGDPEIFLKRRICISLYSADVSGRQRCTGAVYHITADGIYYSKSAWGNL